MPLRQFLALLIICFAVAIPARQAAAASKPPSPYDKYVLGPDSEPHAGVPEGKITEFLLENSKTYSGAWHRWWLYVPAQYDGVHPIALMVFQDGTSFALRDGGYRVPIVLNNLIAKKELPVI